MTLFLDGDLYATAEDLHRALQRMLSLPDYYGMNGDALYDCLGELGPHTHIILVNADTLRSNLGEYGERLIEVFRESAVPGSVHFAVDGE